MGKLNHRILQQTLQLLPERAIFWIEKKTLLVADLHLGKEGTFRHAGIPLPDGPSQETLARLSLVVQKTQAQRLLILGDLFHGDDALATAGDDFDRWRQGVRELPIELVAGSHDRWSGDLPQEWNCTIHEMMRLAPFTLSHYPKPVQDSYVLAGHLHPSYLLKGHRNTETMTFPCFLFRQTMGILPAFGSFTGFTRVTLEKDDRCYIIGEEEVIKIPPLHHFHR
jgi:DNA ligase-associated metallophosphoesterase